MRKYGFIALWKHSDLWYTGDPEKKEKMIQRVNEINREAIEKGVVMSSVYDCSWSSEWHYFTFWECPNLEVLEEAMEELEKCGDVNAYNIQHHFVGREVRNLEQIDLFDPKMLEV